MKKQIIVSNIRMPLENWLEVKAAAGAANMSVNEYFNYLANMNVVRKTVGLGDIPNKSKKRVTIWDLSKLARKKNTPMGLSEEDEIIYGT